MVIIPAYNRPEFLYLCLEHICKAKGALDRQYVFALDYGHDPMLNDVIQAFPLDSFVIKMPAPVNQITKQSANVLNAWIASAKAAKDGEVITLIEDDVFVSEDFFHYVDTVTPLVWASVGAVNFNNRRALNNRPDQYWIDRGVYQSIGVSFTKETILQDIEPHYTMKYLQSPAAYLEANFPHSKIGRDFIEQDGLIHRISEAGNKSVAFPQRPRCFHAGLYGKNRGKYPTGKLQDRIDFVRSVVYDSEQLKKHVQNEYFFYDSCPIDLKSNYYGQITET